MGYKNWNDILSLNLESAGKTFGLFFQKRQGKLEI